jgi:hypothetical protein
MSRQREDQIRRALGGKASDRLVGSIDDYMRDKSPTSRLIRDPMWQKWSTKILERFPGTRAAVRAGQSDTAGAVVLKAMSMISDPDKHREVTRLMGLPPGSDRDAVLALATDALQVESPAQLRAMLQEIDTAEIADRVAAKGWERDAQEEMARPAREPVESASAREDRLSRQDLRGQIEKATRQAESEVPRAEQRRRGRIHTDTDLQVDIARSMQAHMGQPDNLDLAAPGVTAWTRSHASMPEADDAIDKVDEIRTSVRQAWAQAEENRGRVEDSASAAEAIGVLGESARPYLPHEES